MNNETGRKKLKNTIALKRSIYAVVLSVIFIAAVVLVTMLATALADRYPLDIDLTSDRIHTMNDSNVDFIQSVDKKVNIYVCLTEEEYAGTSSSSYNLLYYAATNYFVESNNTTSDYFAQTVELLNKYSMYNDNISVTYLDIRQPSANEITVHFDDYNWTVGDILVESTFEVDGKEITRRTIVPFSETYTLESQDESTTQQYFYYYQMGIAPCYALGGYGIGYNITENNVEYAVSAAIYKVTSESTPVFLIPTYYCEPEYVEDIESTLIDTLTANNFSVEYNDGLITTILTAENMEKYSGIILGECVTDISEDDRDALDRFLDNNGNKGKSLFYFAGTNTYRLTNLCAFLGDWGIGFESGLLYETSSANYINQDPTNMYLTSAETEYTKLSDALSGKYYVSANIVPMSVLYDTSSTATYARETHMLMRTGGYGTTTVMPIDANAEEWTAPSGAKMDTFPVVVLSEDAAVSGDNQYIYSTVTAFASTNFTSSEWLQYSVVANNNFALDVFNAATGVSDNPFNFVAKTITNQDYSLYVTAAKTNAIKIVFMAAIPVIIIATGIIIWIRRKRK